MSAPMLFFLASLSTYWAWWVLAKAAVLQRLREPLYNRWPPSPVRAATHAEWNRQLGEFVHHARSVTRRKTPKVSQLAKLVDCPWCAGFYLAGAMTLLLDHLEGLALPGLWWLGLNVAVVLVHKTISRLGVG